VTVDILSPERVLFTAFGYPMSYIEFTGTLLYLFSVWLIGKRNLLTWPVGILSVLLFMVLFYQIRLYSDALEQIYYLGASFYGWWLWAQAGPRRESPPDVFFSSGRSLVIWAGVTLASGVALGAFMADVHNIAPRLFPEPASYPFVDAVTTVMSFSAMWLLVLRRTESWIYWIVVDLAGIWLYFEKGVMMLGLLYVALLLLATRGLYAWARAASEPGAGQRSPATS